MAAADRDTPELVLVLAVFGLARLCVACDPNGVRRDLVHRVVSFMPRSGRADWREGVGGGLGKDHRWLVHARAAGCAIEPESVLFPDRQAESGRAPGRTGIGALVVPIRPGPHASGRVDPRRIRFRRLRHDASHLTSNRSPLALRKLSPIAAMTDRVSHPAPDWLFELSRVIPFFRGPPRLQRY
jgi:hypothetical protein